MGSPSSRPIPPPAINERPARVGEDVHSTATEAGRDVVFVADLGNSLAADYAAFARRDSRCDVMRLDKTGPAVGVAVPAIDRAASLVVFLPPRLDESGRLALGEILKNTGRRPIMVVGSFRAHLDDSAAEETERLALRVIESTAVTTRVAVFRPGLVLSPNSDVTRWLGRFGPLFPLAPASLRTCFIEGEHFFSAIEAERLADDRTDGDDEAGHGGWRLGRYRRIYTYLGSNIAWREMLERHRGASRARRTATAVATALSWLFLGQLIAVVVSLLAGLFARARPFSVRTLKPRSMGEIIALCHRGNLGHVRVVGYNNGVNHFGHRYPGKTIVSTVRCRRTVNAGSGLLKADCGATIRDAKDYLVRRGDELYVMPNYSYVAIGTSFFVPIHGSAVDYSTVADTACRAIFYDPDEDRIVSAGRDDAAFRENLYNPRSRAVLLRLYLRTRPKSSYYVRRETRKNAGADELLAALRDRDATNVEIRQANAASDTVTVSKYYTEPSGPSGPALESPRDALGRLWDRLEENPVTSFLMHALSRHVAWHTELFLTAGEFDRFWATHAKVSLRKIQLRYITRDGMPHSPFRDEGCVSADLFLFRFDKPAFDRYVADNLPNVRCNPGKHSH